LIHSYRVRGHLMADTDPLQYRVRHHPDLDVETYGLTLWDLDRNFPTRGLGGQEEMPLSDILGVLRDAYCRTIGVEYMHFPGPKVCSTSAPPTGGRGRGCRTRWRPRAGRSRRPSTRTSWIASTPPRPSRRSCRRSSWARSASRSRAESR